MKHFYLICFFLLFQLYKAHGEVAISKMYSKFMVKWTLSKYDFYNSEYEDNYQSNDCGQRLKKTTTIKFPGIKNLAFKLGLFTETTRFSAVSKIFVVGILPEFPHLDISNIIYLDYALVYSPKLIYKLKDPNNVYLPSNYMFSSDFESTRNRIFPNGTATIHCMISVNSQVKTKLISISNARYNSYVLKTNYTSEKIPCYNIGTKGDYIDDYVYSGQIPSMSIAKAMAIIDVHSQRAQQLDAPELLDWSLDYLQKNMASENVIDILNLAYRKNITSLRDSCLDYLKYKCTIKDRTLN